MICQQYAIFDMDGTLLDSMPYWRNILAEYLNMPIPMEHALKIRDMNVTESVELTAKTFNLKKSVPQIFNEMCDLMLYHYLNHVKPKNGVQEYLQMLKQNNIRMCVASASPRHLIKSALEHFELADNFEFLCSTEDGFADKRNPDIYLYCAEKFNSAPVDTAVFEDSYSAIVTAKKANFPVVAIYDDTQKEYWQEITSVADKFKISYQMSKQN